MKKLIAGLAAFLLSGCLCATPTKGEKVGQIIRLQEEGMFNTTTEGQLLRGGLSSGSGAMGVVPFDFTIQDQRLVDIAKKAMVENKEVKVTYHLPLTAGCTSRSGISDGIVDSIEILEH